MTPLALRILGLGDWTLRTVFFLGSFLAMYVLKVSLVSYDPFVQVDAKVIVRKVANSDVILLTEVRELKGLSEDGTNVYSSRSIYEKRNPDNRFLVNGVSFDIGKGPATIVSNIVLPVKVSGEWCSTIKFLWWPSLAQREFEMAVPDVCFNTDDAP